MLFFIAVLFLTFPSASLGRGQFYLRDFHPFFYPQKLFLAQSLGRGELPLWLPHVGCGVPFFASLQPGVAYPPSALLLAAPFQLGLKLFVGFHFLLAFVSAALLARSLLRCGPWASCLAGTAYAFGGYLVSSVSLLNNLQSAAWSPLVLLAFQRLVRCPRRGSLLLASAIVALQLLGGGVEVTGLTLVLAIALSFLPQGNSSADGPTDVGSWRRRVRVWRGPLLVGAATVLGLALAAWQILPTAEMAGRSTRAGGGLAAEESASFSLQPGNLPNIAVPRRLAEPGTRGYFSAFSRAPVPWLISIYQGVVVLYLALAGLFSSRKQGGLLLVLLTFSVAGLILALGDSTACTAALFQGLPGAGWFRYPEKFLFLTALTVPLLAARGCRNLAVGIGEDRSPPKPLAEAAAFLVPLAILLLVCRSGVFKGPYSVILPFFLLVLAAGVRLAARRKVLGPAVAALLLAVLAAVDLSTAHRPLNDTVPADFYDTMPEAARAILNDRHAAGAGDGPAVPPRCRSTLPGHPGGPPATERPQATPLQTHLVWRAYLSPNSAGISGISQVRGSTGMELRLPVHRARLLAAAGLDDQLALLSLWGVDYLLMDRGLSAPQELQLLTDRLDYPEQRLYRMRRSLSRLFLVRAEIARSYPRAEAQLLERGAGISELVGTVRDEAEQRRSRGQEAILTAWEPGKLSAEVAVDEEGLLLAFTEGYDPGWRAEVNGRPAAVYEGLGGFNLVQLPGPGRHQVELNYRPPRLLSGLVIAAVTLLLLLLLPLAPLRRPRGGGTGAPVDRAWPKTYILQ
jgi:hypothetical protein